MRDDVASVAEARSGSPTFCACRGERNDEEASAGGCGKSPASVDAVRPLSPLLQGSSWRVAAAHACSRRSYRQSVAFASPDARASVLLPPATLACVSWGLAEAALRGRRRSPAHTSGPRRTSSSRGSPVARAAWSGRDNFPVPRLPAAAIATCSIGSKGRARGRAGPSSFAKPPDSRSFHRKGPTRRRAGPPVRIRAFPLRYRKSRSYPSAIFPTGIRSIW